MKNKKKKFLIMFAAIFFFVIVIIGTSYAYFTSAIGSDEQKYNVGTLAVDYGKRTNSINLDNTYPLTDNEGLKTTPHEFTVTNNGSIRAKYQIRLELDNTNTVDITKIKMIYSKNGSDYSEPMLLSELDNLVIISEQNLQSAHADTYQIKLWIDYNAGNEVQNKTFSAKIVIDGVQSNQEKINVDTPPIIYLNGEDINLTVGSEFIDPGVLKIEDDKDNLTLENVIVSYEYYNPTIESDNEEDKLVSVENITTNSTGIYYIKYTIIDSFGNIGTAIRTVTINETETTPTITLNGSNNIILTVRETYNEEGITTDTQNNVAIIGEVKTDVVGTYIIRYIVIDKNNNLASTTRVVTVQPKTYLVVFDGTGGEVSQSSKVVVEGNIYGELPIPVKAGYTFNGWWSEPNQELTTQNTQSQLGIQITEQTLFTENSEKTLYAHWTSNEYIMTMDYQYDNLKEIKNNIAYGYKINDLTKSIDAREYSALKREEYTFLGWYDDQVEGNQITGDTVVNFTEDFTLYAHWRANAYPVSFNSNGGSNVSTVSTVTYGSTYGTLPATSRTGYSFLGWYSNISYKGYTVGNGMSQNSNYTFGPYDYFAAGKYVARISGINLNASGLVFDVNSNSNPSAVSYQVESISSNEVYIIFNLTTAVSDLEIRVIGDITKYTYYALNVYNEIISTSTKTTASNETLTAHWIANTYQVSFEPQNGSTISTILTVTYGGTYGTLPTTETIGHTFLGWYDQPTGGNKITSTTAVSDNPATKLYAHWQANNYTLTLNANGGTTSLPSVILTYRTANYYDLSANLPTQTGHTFLGWYTQASGGVQVYNSSGYVTNEGTYWQNNTSVYVGDYTLYAHWSANNYTITYNENVEYFNTSNTTVVGLTRSYNNSNQYLTLNGHPNGSLDYLITPIISINSGDKFLISTEHISGNYTGSSAFTFTTEVSKNNRDLSPRYYMDIVPLPNSGKVISILSINDTAAQGDQLRIWSWTPSSNDVQFNNYVIKVNINKITQVSKTYLTALGTLPEPTRDGYAFLGWYTDPVNGTKISSSTSTPASDTTYYAHWLANGTTYPFDAVGQTPFTTPVSGNYKLEVWGAQGGSYNSTQGGYGGYSQGTIYLEGGTTLYVNVGGKGNIGTTGTIAGGYNGGGSAYSAYKYNTYYYMGSGGGATHIATIEGELKTLGSYVEPYDSSQGISQSSKILIVAGGGGGASHDSGDGRHVASGGSGGGYIGSSVSNDLGTGAGGNQQSAGNNGGFGYGGSGKYTISSGAGGGFYGGGVASHDNAPSGGGSGYIGNSRLENASMTIYCTSDCTQLTTTLPKIYTSTVTSSSSTATSGYAKSGNGYAQITYVGQ